MSSNNGAIRHRWYSMVGHMDSSDIRTAKNLQPIALNKEAQRPQVVEALDKEKKENENQNTCKWRAQQSQRRQDHLPVKGTSIKY